MARDLAAYLRPATGYPLAVVAGDARPGDILLVIGDPAGLKPADRAEGYELQTTGSTARIEAPTAHGLYNGIQTLRQLLPPWINSARVAPGPWTMPVVTIIDYPRYQYRGVLLDIARHYEPPAAVEELIAQVAAYKVNVLHLHLSDDQGFRLAIAGFPRLTSIGGAGSVGTGGRTEIVADPGPRHSTGRWWPTPPTTSSPSCRKSTHPATTTRSSCPSTTPASCAARQPPGHQLRPVQPAAMGLHRRRRRERTVPGQPGYLGDHDGDHRPAHRLDSRPLL